MIPLFSLLLRGKIVSKAIQFLHNLSGYHVIVHEMSISQHNSQLHAAPSDPLFDYPWYSHIILLSPRAFPGDLGCRLDGQRLLLTNKKQ